MTYDVRSFRRAGHAGACTGNFIRKEASVGILHGRSLNESSEQGSVGQTSWTGLCVGAS